jgi:hypothetical protein
MSEKKAENSLRQLSRQEKARLLAARANEISYHSTHDEEAPLIKKQKQKKDEDDEEEKGDEVRIIIRINMCHSLFSSTFLSSFSPIAGKHLSHCIFINVGV